MCSPHKPSSTGRSDLPKATMKALGELALSNLQSHFSEPQWRHKLSWKSTKWKYWEFPAPMKSQPVYTQSNGSRKFSLPPKKKDSEVCGDSRPGLRRRREETVSDLGTVQNRSQMAQATGRVSSRLSWPAIFVALEKQALRKAQSIRKSFFLAWSKSNYKSSPWNFKPY